MRARVVVPIAILAGTLLVAGAELKLRAAALNDTTVSRAATGVLTLRATDLHGRSWTADRLRGRVMLIDFWATWCAPCLAELPRLKALREGYTREEFEILGVMLESSSRRTIVSWLNRHRIDWPQIQERGGYSGALAAAFGVRQLPATVLVDTHGRVAAVGLRGNALRQRIEQLVNAARLSPGPGALPSASERSGGPGQGAAAALAFPPGRNGS